METKICHKCGRELPATKEFFYRDYRYKEPFRSPCKDCCRAIIDRGKRVEYMKVFNNSHIEYLKQYHHDYAARNKEKYRVYKRANKEHFTKFHREYVKRNRDKIRADNKKWEAANKEKRNEQARIHCAKRKAQKIAGGGTVTLNDIHAQYDRQNGRCYYCNIRVGKKYHIDHVIPLSRGGSHSPENIVIACPSCNVHKSDKLPHEWIDGGHLL